MLKSQNNISDRNLGENFELSALDTESYVPDTTRVKISHHATKNYDPYPTP